MFQCLSCYLFLHLFSLSLPQLELVLLPDIIHAIMLVYPYKKKPNNQRIIKKVSQRISPCKKAEFLSLASLAFIPKLFFLVVAIPHMETIDSTRFTLYTSVDC